VNRSAFLLGSLAAPLAAHAALETVRTQFSWLPNVEYAGFFLAQERGWFADAGIAHRYLPGGPRLPSVAAMVANGAADAGVDELDKVVDAVRAGDDLVILGAIYQRPVGGLLSLPGHPIVRAADLVGARIGIQSGGREYIDGILRLNHLPVRYTAVAVGESPGALLNGECEGFLCYLTNQPLMLDQRGIRYVVRSLTAFGYFGYDGCIFVRRRTLQTRRATLVRYLGAVRRGWEWNVADPVAGTQATLRIAPPALQLNRAQQLQQNRAQAPFMQSAVTRRFGLLAVDRAGVGRAYATLRAEGRSTLPPFERLFDLSLLHG
jgi:ABC-type nitrate/sulfonate/bicarbonate transport system substrate-binding protein